MSLLKILKRNPEIAREFAQRVEANQPYRLLDMKAYLTRACNLRCVMCNAWNDNQGRRGELSTDDWFRIIVQARALGLANLKLFGGEPMLRQDLEAIVEYAAGLGIRCALITNGTLLTEQRAGGLVAAGLAELDVSLDAANPTLHDEIRGLPGAWSRAVRGIQLVRQAAQRLDRRVAIRVNTVVMRQNYEDIPRLVNVLSNLAVDEIALNPAIPQDGNTRASASEYVLSRQDIVRYNHHVAPKILGQAPPGRLSMHPDFLYIYGTAQDHIDLASQCRYTERLHIRCCFKPWYYMIVRENGDVMGCNTVKHPMSRLGNLQGNAIEDIWFSEAYQTFRAHCKPPQFADCARCCYNLALLNQQMEEVLNTSASRTP